MTAVWHEARSEETPCPLLISSILSTMMSLTSIPEAFRWSTHLMQQLHPSDRYMVSSGTPATDTDADVTSDAAGSEPRSNIRFQNRKLRRSEERRVGKGVD